MQKEQNVFHIAAREQKLAVFVELHSKLPSGTELLLTVDKVYTVEPLYYGPLNYGHLPNKDGWHGSWTHAQCCDTNLTPNYGHLRIPYYGRKPWPQTDVTSINSTPYYGQYDVTASSECRYK